MPCKCAGTSFFIVVVLVLSHVPILTYAEDELQSGHEYIFIVNILEKNHLKVVGLMVKLR